MARTYHHRSHKKQHNGHDYGGKFKCNKGYAQPYGADGRHRAAREMRADRKRVIHRELIHRCWV